VIAKAQAEAAEHARISEAERARAARWLWSQRRPIKGAIAERYLREVRGYAGPLPSTLGYLPPRDNYEPAMIGAFGVPSEPELLIAPCAASTSLDWPLTDRGKPALTATSLCAD